MCLYGWRSARKIVPLALCLPERNCVSTVVILATSRPLDILLHPLLQLTFSLHRWTSQTDLLRPPLIKVLLQLQWLRFVWFVVVFDFCCWESIVFFLIWPIVNGPLLEDSVSLWSISEATALFCDKSTLCLLEGLCSYNLKYLVYLRMSTSWNLLLLLLLLALQPTVGFSLLSDSLPFCSFFTLLSPPSYSHYLQIFFNVCNPSLPWSPSSCRTYRFPL